MGNEILPGMYLGDIAAATSKEVLEKHHITHVVDCSNGNNHLRLQGVEYMEVNVIDAPGSDISAFFDDAVAFIHQARQREGSNVLVHCFRGVSRSATIVLAFLFRHEVPLMPRKDGTQDQTTTELTKGELLDYLRERRPSVAPNTGFWGQLLRIKRDVDGSSAPAALLPAGES